jgi:mRNA-degrading endonuclease RelE of RelBE toxin-antitoxin system
MAYNLDMLIVETSIFTQQVQILLTHEEYRLLQLTLVDNPASGDVIPGSGGLRKVRWGAAGKGKRGGSRVIYYWAVSQSRILMLFVYRKSEQSDLTQDQLQVLRNIVEEEYP